MNDEFEIHPSLFVVLYSLFEGVETRRLPPNSLYLSKAHGEGIVQRVGKPTQI